MVLVSGGSALIPFATVLWQVRDALEKNGKIKIEGVKSKKADQVWKIMKC